MSDDFPQAMREDYWESLGASESLLDVVQEAAGDDWDVRAVDVAGETESGVLFLLVVRQRMGDNGSLILREGYARVDPDADRLVSWTDNYVDRRIQGSLPKALLRIYAAIDAGGATPEDPLVLDSRDHDLNDDPEIVVEGIGDEVEDEIVDEDESDEGRVAPVDRTTDPHAGAERDAHRCSECGEVADKEDLVNMGGALGQDLWVHQRACSEYGDDDE